MYSVATLMKYFVKENKLKLKCSRWLSNNIIINNNKYVTLFNNSLLAAL